MKDLTKERALELHRQMWSDMQVALGDNPNRDARWQYKCEWIEKHFSNEDVHNDCFLCEYCANQQFSNRDDFDYDYCKCPIVWPKGRCEDDADNAWYNMPISELLALPERSDEEDEEIEEEPADVKAVYTYAIWCIMQRVNVLVICISQNRNMRLLKKWQILGIGIMLMMMAVQDGCQFIVRSWRRNNEICSNNYRKWFY